MKTFDERFRQKYEGANIEARSTLQIDSMLIDIKQELAAILKELKANKDGYKGDNDFERGYVIGWNRNTQEQNKKIEAIAEKYGVEVEK